jgi:hypothetical protein
MKFNYDEWFEKFIKTGPTEERWNEAWEAFKAPFYGQTGQPKAFAKLIEHSIPASPDDPKILRVDDPEIVGYSR